MVVTEVDGVDDGVVVVELEPVVMVTVIFPVDVVAVGVVDGVVSVTVMF